MTLVELLVVIAVLAVLVALLLPVLAAAKRRSSRINCVSNLKQVNLSFRIWEGDHNNKYPMAVSVTNGGAMETVATGDVVNCFRVMSNEMSVAMILCCPDDTNHTPTRSFGPDFNSSNISYFIGADADETYPHRLLSGDDNFQNNGSPVSSGLFQFSTNAAIAWDSRRHDNVTRVPYLRIPTHHSYCGNLGFADGSVGMFYTPGLRKAFVQSDVATNRLAIP